MVKTLPFASSQVPVPGYGAMGLSAGLGTNLSYDEAEPVLLKALELGCTFWDTAVVYGAGINEKLLGDFIRKHKCREKLFIASKCGLDVFGGGKFSVDNSPEHIRKYIEGTIDRLGFAPDLYYLHRIDPNTPLEDSISALDSIRKAGKCKYIGLSECSAATLRKANSIAHIDAELGVAYVAFSPLGHGWLVDNFDYASPQDFAEDDFRRTSPKFQGENFYKNKAIVEEIKKLADRKGCTTSQLALSWVASQGLIPIAGTTKAGRLVENWGSREVVFSEEELKEMRRIVDEAKVEGERYGEAHSRMVGH
ncbi:Aldo-keto yakc [NADP(+)] [Cyphellophora attinorum]|uniref:Aldo-keto yakc [NADP(+)] n=1 Tax=Cyphellophora attinorum TaxID=1664694 RepID=A0A0N1HCG0_9EURO|nr:Aldo-keto yakc [NADP(+)] [Phialophora attinorum]KPI42024.1 Aldo-keto yakc [NADP(+)] [Phialophora attinorum]